MKTRNFLAKLLLGTVFTVFAVSCDDDYDSSWVPNDVRSSFYQMYPGAKWVEWESEGAYIVASFRSGAEREVWFSSIDGTWQMTETDLRYASLPEAVRTAHQASEYGTWGVDDVDLIERPDKEPVYVIDVERRTNGQELEHTLYYSADGTPLESEQFIQHLW